MAIERLILSTSDGIYLARLSCYTATGWRETVLFKKMLLNLQCDYEVSPKSSALQGRKAQPQQSHFVVECK